MTGTATFWAIAIASTYALAAPAGGFLRLNCNGTDASLSITDLRPREPSKLQQLNAAHPQLGNERVELAPGGPPTRFVVTALSKDEVELVAIPEGGGGVWLLGRTPEGTTRRLGALHYVRLRDRSGDTAIPLRPVDVTVDIYKIEGGTERLDFRDCHLVRALGPNPWLALWKEP